MMPVNMLNDGTVIERGDECLGVRFFLHEVLDERRSAEEGRNIYQDIEMIEVIIPGCKDVLHRKVDEKDKIRFQKQWNAYKDTKTEAISGTPLTHFPFISPGERKELEYYNIYTGEQLLAVPDGNVDRIHVNARELIKKAKAFMDVGRDRSVAVRLAEENDFLKREMDLLKEQMNQILKIKEKDIENGNEGNEIIQHSEIRNDKPRRGRKKSRNGIEHSSGESAIYGG